MPNDVNENIRVKLALPAGKINVPKFLYVIVLILGFLILLVSLVNIYLSKQKKNPAESEKITPALPNPNLETIKNTLAWLNKQKDKRGYYYRSVSCNTNKVISCNQPVEAGKSGQDGLTSIWGRYKYYQLYGNVQDLETVNSDINNYEKGIKVMEIQNDFWNCKLMFDLWQSNDFNEEQKKKIENLCWTGTYLNIPEIESFTLRVPKDNSLVRSETNLKTEIPKINLKNPGNLAAESEDQMVKLHFKEFASYASDFVARYKWKTDEKYKKIAEGYFNKSVKLYFQEPKLYEGDALCVC